METRIHPRDEMYRFELAATHRTADIAAIRYFAVGNSVARTVGELSDWRFGGCAQVGTLLDFLLRLAGPVLLAFAVLALRARTKR